MNMLDHPDCYLDPEKIIAITPYDEHVSKVTYATEFDTLDFEVPRQVGRELVGSMRRAKTKGVHVTEEGETIVSDPVQSVLPASFGPDNGPAVHWASELEAEIVRLVVEQLKRQGNTDATQ